MAVTAESWEAWLDPRMDDVDAVLGLMTPPTGLEIYAISKAVNAVKNNGPELLKPVPAEPTTGKGTSSARLVDTQAWRRPSWRSLRPSSWTSADPCGAARVQRGARRPVRLRPGPGATLPAPRRTVRRCPCSRPENLGATVAILVGSQDEENPAEAAERTFRQPMETEVSGGLPGADRLRRGVPDVNRSTRFVAEDEKGFKPLGT